MWICPKCSTSVEPSFEICWSCGTTVDGVEDPTFVTADNASPIKDPSDNLRKSKESSVEPELPEPPLELVECYRARDSAEAKFLMDRLAEIGIMALANGTHMGNTEYMLPLFSPRIEVRAEDYARARGLVDEFELRKKARLAGVENL
ncbi:putative signal transducing protein [Singulisphaera acidiphila]|uniref:DUF2007 domain-containing protein n=1 Tax=Singulisphaera acidiphila (strain ATCC BAA-1392 / DSM 18658 / VKM B-2454 / MOB10) TaxID=886293 RepID=L0DCF3_SINAD|nr:DUF2007 domain-containing protein [Singulisphaera acidiphila]AGA26897.1 Protein of unknown function (DUF2007) [Singulisphaera acidiphila DSM 18658]